MHVLELLERDREFRCAVAGYIGISEVLKRLNELIEEPRNLRDEQRDLREKTNKNVVEIEALRRGHVKIWEEIRRIRKSRKASERSKQKSGGK